jgi:hypothetical protein
LTPPGLLWTDGLKALWPVLGRPGAILVDGDVIGTWRPRTSGPELRLEVRLWTTASAAVRGEIANQSERLAAYRRVQLAGIDVDG